MLALDPLERDVLRLMKVRSRVGVLACSCSCVCVFTYASSVACAHFHSHGRVRTYMCVTTHRNLCGSAPNQSHRNQPVALPQSNVQRNHNTKI